MSRRAIRRLQETREATLHAQEEGDNDDDDDEEDDERDYVKAKRAPAFLAAFDDDEEDDDESSTADDDDDGDDDSGKKSTAGVTKDDACGGDRGPKEEDRKIENVYVVNQKDDAKPNSEIMPNDEDDLDLILAEFRSPVNPSNEEAVEKAGDINTALYFQIVADGMDVRDLDIEFVIRTTLSGSTSDAAPVTRRNRRNRQLNLFGNPRDDWIRPPHFVGGGIGMTTYDVAPRPIPWPYNKSSLNKGWDDPSRWFRFQCSDSYNKDCNDYLHIQQSGDVNALALFLSHHPYVTDALLQLAMVLYQTNHNQEGLLLIRRTLWIYECSSLPGFTPQDGINCFMDYHQIENSPFFLALFRLMQVSSIAGCMRTSLAVARYLLSLDPLRDPVGVLLILDCFALSCNTATHSKWLVDLVESRKVQVFHRDSASNEKDSPEYQADLVDLPNFAFSYALAMFHLHESEDPSSGDVGWLERSDLALQKAIQKFPTVVEALLEKNDVDVSTGRSMITDWKSVMPFLWGLSSAYSTVESIVDPEVRSVTMTSCELLIRIFSERNFKLWGKENVLRWLYRNVETLKSSYQANIDHQPGAEPPSPALMRYAPMDPEDYADRIRTLPPEANPLDPNLLVPALAMNANRRRFLQRNPRQQPREDEWEVQRQEEEFAGLILIGGPPTHVIDPDLPLMELFWRSALPWNRVEGVPRPNR